MNMFARFDENPAMTLRVIKETKRYGRTHGRTDGRTDNVKTVYPLQTKFAGGINYLQGDADFYFVIIINYSQTSKGSSDGSRGGSGGGLLESPSPPPSFKYPMKMK